MAEPAPGKIDRVFSKALERRTRGRSGLYMHSRFPNVDWENGKTAAPYSVFQGFNDLFEDFEGWLSRRLGTGGAWQHLRPQAGALCGRCVDLCRMPLGECGLARLQPRGFPDEP